MLDARVAYLMTTMMEGVMNFGTALRGSPAWLYRSRRRQDRKFARWLVRRLHQQSAVHRLGGIRRLQRLAPERRPDRGPYLGGVHEEGSDPAAVLRRASRFPSPLAWWTCNSTRPRICWQLLPVQKTYSVAFIAGTEPSETCDQGTGMRGFFSRVFGLGGEKALPPPPPGRPARTPGWAASCQAAEDPNKKKKGFFGKIAGIFKDDKPSNDPPPKPADSSGKVLSRRAGSRVGSVFRSRTYGSSILCFVLLAAIATASCWPDSFTSMAQVIPPNKLQVSPPPMRRADLRRLTPPSSIWKQRGDILRAGKILSGRARLLPRRAGEGSEQRPALQQDRHQRTADGTLRRRPQGFRALHQNDRQFADAYNNLGVIYYLRKEIRQGHQAIRERHQAASGFRLFLQQSRSCVFLQEGITRKPAWLTTRRCNGSRDLRADFPQRSAGADVVSRRPRALLLRAGQDLCQEPAPLTVPCNTCAGPWRRATRGSKTSTRTQEFAGLRKDPRFTELMAARPVAIPE